MKLRIYTDTSVIGGCLDLEFQAPSSRLVEKFKLGEAIIVLSDLTRLELTGAPEKVRDVLKAIPDGNREYVDLTAEARELAEHYLNEGVIGPGKRIDAQHIAIATISRVDVLVSWNSGILSIWLALGVTIRSICGKDILSLRSGVRGRCSPVRKAKKTFDAVATMRTIRDRLSAQIEGMSFEEEKGFIRKHVPQAKARGSKQPPDETILQPRLRSTASASAVPSARKKRAPRRG